MTIRVQHGAIDKHKQQRTRRLLGRFPLEVDQIRQSRKPKRKSWGKVKTSNERGLL